MDAQTLGWLLIAALILWAAMIVLAQWRKP